MPLPLDSLCHTLIHTMYKLLSDEVRKMVEGEYAVRRAVVIVGSLIFVLVVAVTGILPSYLLSKSRHEEVSERARIAGSMEPDIKSQEMQGWLAGINLKIKVLSRVVEQEKFSGVIESIISEKASGIRLSSFSWKQDGVDILVTVSGVAESRQSLLAFEDKLRGSKEFKEVTLPVSNLAKDRDVPFDLKLTPNTK